MTTVQQGGLAASRLVHTGNVATDPAGVRAQLDRILASDAFTHAGRLRRLLAFLVDRSLAGNGDQLKEYVLGVEVFDRDERYDPRLDSIVRVEVRRLRTKLAEYYSGEGAGDPLIIRLQPGNYAPFFEERPDPPPTRHHATAENKHSPLLRRFVPLGLIAATLVIALGFAAWRSRAGATISRDEPVAPITIAVLPFAHYSTDARHDLLAARLTDGVTTELARLGTLGVVSSTSALQFAGPTTGSRQAPSTSSGPSQRHPLREVARALNADVVMEATVYDETERVRVEARLVNAMLDRKFWVGDFDGAHDELHDLEQRIAAAAAAAAIERYYR